MLPTSTNHPFATPGQRVLCGSPLRRAPPPSSQEVRTWIQRWEEFIFMWVLTSGLAQIGWELPFVLWKATRFIARSPFTTEEVAIHTSSGPEHRSVRFPSSALSPVDRPDSLRWVLEIDRHVMCADGPGWTVPDWERDRQVRYLQPIKSDKFLQPDELWAWPFWMYASGRLAEALSW